jgi:hypothetical protein
MDSGCSLATPRFCEGLQAFAQFREEIALRAALRPAFGWSLHRFSAFTLYRSCAICAAGKDTTACVAFNAGRRLQPKPVEMVDWRQDEEESVGF